MITIILTCFYCRTAFGKLDSQGDKLQTIRKKSKYGNPTDDLGQPANGGLTYIDQRQLNRIYCEDSRNSLVPNELSEIIRHKIQENPAQTIDELGLVLEQKFSKIYPNYYYLVHAWHSGFQQAAVTHNGSSCVTVTDQGKRHVIVCYARKRIRNEWPEVPLYRIERAVEANIRALRVNIIFTILDLKSDCCCQSKFLLYCRNSSFNFLGFSFSPCFWVLQFENFSHLFYLRENFKIIAAKKINRKTTLGLQL